MKTTLPIHIDTADLARLRDQMKDQMADLTKMDLSKVDLPKLEGVGRTADETIDRLLGRSRPRVWPWVAASVGLLAVVGTIAAAFMWLRRPATMTSSSTVQPVGTPEASAFTDEPLIGDSASYDDMSSSTTSTPDGDRIFRGDEAV